MQRCARRRSRPARQERPHEHQPRRPQAMAPAAPASTAHDPTAHGPEATRIVVAYGFWIFLISDIILFAAFFATYAVLTDAHRRRPARRDLFDMHARRGRDGVPADIELHLRHRRASACRRAASALYHASMAVTCCWGRLPGDRAARVRRHGRRRRGAVAQRLPVGVLRAHRLPRPARHRRHAVAADDDGAGVAKGFREDIRRRMLCFSLFWHTLDIIWVALFSLVYLVGLSR